MERDDCSICFEELSQDLYTLNCKHVFHRDCITRWLHTSPNCPLCRAPVDPDTRYVDDGIMSEERREYIESMKAVCMFTAQGLEYLFPQGLEGYTANAADFLDSEEGKELLENASNQESGLPRDLLMALGRNGISQFIANGGLTRMYNYYMNTSPPE